MNKTKIYDAIYKALLAEGLPNIEAYRHATCIAESFTVVEMSKPMTEIKIRLSLIAIALSNVASKIQ